MLSDSLYAGIIAVIAPTKPPADSNLLTLDPKAVRLSLRCPTRKSRERPRHSSKTRALNFRCRAGGCLFARQRCSATGPADRRQAIRIVIVRVIGLVAQGEGRAVIETRKPMMSRVQQPA